MAAAPAVNAERVAQDKTIQTVPADQQREQAELARLQAEVAAREKADQEAALQREAD